MQTATFKIDGMRCKGCADTIHRLLSVQPGVRAASVSLEEGQARILYDPDAISEGQLAALIEKPGYRVVDRA